MRDIIRLNIEFQKHIKSNINKVKYNKIYNVLDKDILNGIIQSGDVFWIEPCVGFSYGVKIPNYVYNEIIRWGKKIMGLKYLYDLEVNHVS